MSRFLEVFLQNERNGAKFQKVDGLDKEGCFSGAPLFSEVLSKLRVRLPWMAVAGSPERIGKRVVKNKLTAGLGLTEVLVAVAIMALLVAMTVPLVSSLRERRDDLICMSNLRQIGLSILAYSNENQGRLPGPLILPQYGYWDDHDTVLPTYLKDYVPVITSSTKTVGDIFICPANRRKVLLSAITPVFVVNTKVLMKDRTGPQVPFGYANSYHRGYRSGSIDEQPMALWQLDDIVDAEGRSAR